MLTGYELLLSDHFNSAFTVLERFSMFDEHIEYRTVCDIRRYKFYFYFWNPARGEKFIRYW